MSKTNAKAVFTICSWNYFAYALTLRTSFLNCNPDTRFCIFVADTPRPDLMATLGDIDVYLIDENIVPSYRRMALIYKIMEYNTAVKPFCFDFMFDVLRFENVLYLDPDIYVTSSVETLFGLLEGGSDAVLTPHITSSIDDGFHPGDLEILRCGIYNLGFIGLANRGAARAFISWWRRWLTEDCVVALEEGIFVDQKFCDMVPAFVTNTHILHDYGYNLAYWNLNQRQLTIADNGDLLAGGDLVKFIHFSGVNKDKPHEFSKHQNRYSRGTIGLLRPIFDAYVNHLLANDDYILSSPDGTFVRAKFSSVPYGFSDAIDGVPRSDLINRCIQRHRREIPSCLDKYPLGREFFVKASSEIDCRGGAPIGRLLAEVYFTRPDLKSIFDCETSDGRLELTRWAVEHFPLEYDLPIEWALDHVTLNAISRERGKLSPKKTTIRSPWHSLLVKRRSLARVGTRDKTSVGGTQRHGLAIYGLLHTESGVGQSARSLADAFKTSGLLNSTHALLPAHAANNVAYSCSRPQITDLDHVLLVLNADNICSLESWMDPALIASYRKRIGFFVWELPVFPAMWAAAFDKVDEIWVPSEYVATSLKTATNKPVHVVPYPVSPAPVIDTAEARVELCFPNDRLIYLVAFDFNSFPERKNAFAAVRAFIDAFPVQNENTPLLVLKFHGVFNRGTYLQRIRSVARGRSDVIIIDEIFSALDMHKLRAAADVYVSLHRAEGFGLNLAECMSAGKLVIATAFSGNVDFMNAGNSILIDYDMRQVNEGEYVAGNGQWWADPKHRESVEAMRYAACHCEKRRTLGDVARSTIAESLSLEVIGRRMASLI